LAVYARLIVNGTASPASIVQMDKFGAIQLMPAHVQVVLTGTVKVASHVLVGSFGTLSSTHVAATQVT
jgi:hypothetical protein